MSFMKDFLQSNNVDVIVTREPGGTALGEEIRSLLLKEREGAVSAMAELLLMFAARAQHIEEVIEPALSTGTWVLCDRFTDATYAYQSGGRGMPAENVRALEDLVQKTLRPDCTILLDVDVSVGMARAQDRGELDRIEQEAIDFFERVRSRYLQIAARSSGRCRVIDASEPIEGVERQLLQLGQELLGCWSVRQPLLEN